jgi:hypothetical protein
MSRGEQTSASDDVVDEIEAFRRLGVHPVESHVVRPAVDPADGSVNLVRAD